MFLTIRSSGMLYLYFTYFQMKFFLGMWVRTTTSIIRRYEELCINIVNFESRLQSLYMTVQNFKEGIDMMYRWSEATYQSMDKMTMYSG